MSFPVNYVSMSLTVHSVVDSSDYRGCFSLPTHQGFFTTDWLCQRIPASIEDAEVYPQLEEVLKEAGFTVGKPV